MKWNRYNTKRDIGALGQCDRCGYRRPLKDLVFQQEWSGNRLINTHLRVCSKKCLDKPQDQFRTIIIPPDPPPLKDPRPDDTEGGP